MLFSRSMKTDRENMSPVSSRIQVLEHNKSRTCISEQKAKDFTNSKLEKVQDIGDKCQAPYWAALKLVRTLNAGVLVEARGAD